MLSDLVFQDLELHGRVHLPRVAHHVGGRELADGLRLHQVS